MLVWHGLKDQPVDVQDAVKKHLTYFDPPPVPPTPEQIRLYGLDATIAMSYINEAKNRNVVRLTLLAITTVPPLLPFHTELEIISCGIVRLDAATLAQLDVISIEHCPELVELPRFPLRPFKRIIIRNNPKLPTIRLVFTGGDWRAAVEHINSFVTEMELARMTGRIKI